MKLATWNLVVNGRCLTQVIAGVVVEWSFLPPLFKEYG